MTEIIFKTMGNGPDILLLHGWSGNIKSLEPLANCLSEKGYRVSLIEWPGCGESKSPKDPMTLFNYVELLKDSITRLGLIDPVLVGHSFGGKVILKACIMYPSEFQKIVLINSSGIKPRNGIKRRIFKLFSKGASKVTDLPVIKNFKDKIRYGYYRFIVREMDYLKSKDMKKTFRNIINEDLDEHLSKITADALIVWGEKDNITPLWMGEALHKNIRGAKLKVIEDTRHSLPLVEPLKVSELIYNYLHKVNS